MATKKKFSIITASYNCSNYLDEYFTSIYNNNYPVEIIFVDDGSTDETYTIVQKWTNKLNINYIYQKNQGQAIARNNGMKYATNEWVTFIDADDFIAKNYFKNVNYAINYSRGKTFIATPLIFFKEGSEEYSNTHSLNYKFKGRLGIYKRNLLKNQNSFHLSMATLFFKKDWITDLEIRDIKPQFEDAFFIAECMLKNNNYNITFTKYAEYYYRKRELSNSTVDLSNANSIKYTSLLEHGYLNLLKLYGQYFEKIPLFLQNMIIYDLSWNIKALELNPNLLSFKEENIREDYLKEIFSYIDFEQIVHNNKYLWKQYAIGIHKLYYNDNKKIAGNYLIHETATYYKNLLISEDLNWRFVLDGKSVSLDEIDYRVIILKMNNQEFVNKVFIKIDKNIKNYEVYYNEKLIPETKLYKYNMIQKKSEPLMLFFDRVDKADDNAEVMYEYMKSKGIKNIYFILSKESKDYSRLLEKNFNIIDFGSIEFEQMYLKADYVFSSGFDLEISNYRNLRYPRTQTKFKFIFLQHGVITDDLSNILSAIRLDTFVTSANIEYDNVLNKYSFFKEEVIKTGLPRFDLLKNNQTNMILIQFTWRKTLDKCTDDQFLKSDYYKNIISIIGGITTNDVIHLVIHPRLNKFLHLFAILESDKVKVLCVESIVLREEFNRAKLLITDYSSVFADFAYLNKPIIFFQPDEKDFFASHTYSKEMDYKKDGLGPVVENVEELLELINQNYQMENIYQERIKNFYKYRDQNNCERVYINVLGDYIESGILPK